MTDFMSDAVHAAHLAFVLLVLFSAIVALDGAPHAYRSVRNRIKREIGIWKHAHRKRD